MRLRTPEKIRTLQRKLYLKAKAEPDFRFYLLYDKVYREDILFHAYRLARSNKGAPGVDGQSFEEIEAMGLEGWLSGIRDDLRAKTYRPEPVRRAMVPKPGGGERPLGIPTIRDRVVQGAVKLVIEPIFEADLEPSAYGYRPKRSAGDAVQAVHKLLCRGYTDVVDADLSKYFDTIPHAELMQSVARHIVDRNVLRLIKLWLKTPVEETDGDGKRRMTGGRGSTRGTPQGGIVSPLLAALYMNRFLKYWRITGQGTRFRAEVVNYADDLVILSRGHAREALAWTRQVMTRLGLTLNEAKTSVRDGRKESFDFLGYSFGPPALSQGWPRVSGGEPVQEERGSAQAEGPRAPAARARVPEAVEHRSSQARPGDPGLAGEATAPSLARCAPHGAGRFRLLRRHKMLSWCERHEVGYIVGLAKNARINDQAARGMALAAAAYERTGEKQRVFADLCYGARSWNKERRVIARLEHGPKGANPPYVITNLEGEAKALYERLYCARGEMENRIKEQQLALFADRTSCHKWWPNQFRLILSSLAYTLIATIRRLGLRGTTMARAQADTIRLKLLKIGAVVIRNTAASASISPAPARTRTWSGSPPSGSSRDSRPLPIPNPDAQAPPPPPGAGAAYPKPAETG